MFPFKKIIPSWEYSKKGLGQFLVIVGHKRRPRSLEILNKPSIQAIQGAGQRLHPGSVILNFRCSLGRGRGKATGGEVRGRSSWPGSGWVQYVWLSSIRQRLLSALWA